MAVETVRLKLNQEQDSLGRLWQASNPGWTLTREPELDIMATRTEEAEDQEPAAVARQLVVLIHTIIVQQQQLSYQPTQSLTQNNHTTTAAIRPPPPSTTISLRSAPPLDSSSSNEQPDYFHQPSRPLITSSPSTTSTTTSPSIQAAKPELTTRNLSSTTLHRRATSTIGFKHKRQPLSNARVHSSTSCSVSPCLGQTREPASSQQEQSPWLGSSSPLSSPEPLEDFSKPTDLTQTTTTTTSDSHQESNHGPNPSTTGYDSSASIIPDSLASSHTTTHSSNFMPDPPPPTPSQNGAPLPTTMSVGLQKNKNKTTALLPSILPAIFSPTPTTTTTPTTTNNNGGGKKKAKFFIKEYEADDDKIISPTSFPTQPVVLAQLPRFTQPAIQPLTKCTSSLVAQKVLQGGSKTTKEVVQLPSPSSRAVVKQGEELEEEDEDSEGTDSDEWGSE
ncbi:hypothetical protein H4Q26_005546 [Puccinia striiformis f. sp. tritici PST-130]|nr:hypothetical protein H4Q26_005546 [Puccinia striiformis f. sp. tritici PST-130]